MSGITNPGPDAVDRWFYTVRRICGHQDRSQLRCVRLVGHTEPHDPFWRATSAERVNAHAERESLAAVIHDGFHFGSKPVGSCIAACWQRADAILAAGWVSPAVVASKIAAAHVDALAPIVALLDELDETAEDDDDDMLPHERVRGVIASFEGWQELALERLREITALRADGEVNP